MKGQSEIIVFILLFVIGVGLFMSSVVWSRGIFDTNSDMANLNAAESFTKRLDSKIQNVMKFGGEDSIEYNFDGTIEITGNDKIELKREIDIDIPENWTIIHNDYSIIREKKEGNLLRVQLYYPQNEFAIYLYSDGTKLATPERVLIEKKESFIESGITFNKIKLTFE